MLRIDRQTLSHMLVAALMQRHVQLRAQFCARTRKNLDVAREAIARAPSASLLEVEGGWYAIVRVPETRTDEEWTLELVENDAVHVQPGYFFDMHRGAHLVVSLLTPEDVLAEGMKRIAARIEQHA